MAAIGLCLNGMFDLPGRIYRQLLLIFGQNFIGLNAGFKLRHFNELCFRDLNDEGRNRGNGRNQFVQLFLERLRIRHYYLRSNNGYRSLFATLSLIPTVIKDDRWTTLEFSLSL